VTRCFGWGLPKTSIIPFADCINHHNVDSTYELIHVDYHAHKYDEDPLTYGSSEQEQRKGPPNYYSPSKIEGDYSDFFLEFKLKHSSEELKEDKEYDEHINA
jgi:hypothetical protein